MLFVRERKFKYRKVKGRKVLKSNHSEAPITKILVTVTLDMLSTYI